MLDNDQGQRQGQSQGEGEGDSRAPTILEKSFLATEDGQGL